MRGSAFGSAGGVRVNTTRGMLARHGCFESSTPIVSRSACSRGGGGGEAAVLGGTTVGTASATAANRFTCSSWDESISTSPTMSDGECVAYSLTISPPHQCPAMTYGGGPPPGAGKAGGGAVSSHG